MSKVLSILSDAIDLHVHSLPDYYPYEYSAYELAMRAKEVGFRALLIKSHYYPTASLAYLLREVVGLDIYGSITLNLPMGGFNVHAVNVAIKMGAKIIWMPTLDSWNHKHYYEERGGGLTILSPKGSLLSDVEEILALIANSNAILATGHLSPSETEILVKEAFNIGIKKVIVTHPIWGSTLMTDRQRKRLAEMGAYIEFPLSALTPQKGSLNPTKFVEMIHKASPERCILSSDYGFYIDHDPLGCWLKYIPRLLKAGLLESEIDIMIKENPAHLLTS